MPDTAMTAVARQAVADREASSLMETVVADGDLGKLTSPQRLRFYLDTCKSLSLNPYTRPFEYVRLQGKMVLYARRDCADQLRSIRGISLQVLDKRIDEGLFIVTVRATDAAGRSDEDFGTVNIEGLKGEARANAMLKAITKAKRRVTLSICGLGMNDETEVETIPGAEQVRDAMPPIEGSAEIHREQPPPVEKRRTFKAWLDETLAPLLAAAQSFAGIDAIIERDDVSHFMAKGSDAQKHAIHDLVAAARLRVGETAVVDADDGWPGPDAGATAAQEG